MATNETLFMEEHRRSDNYARILCSLETDPESGHLVLISNFYCLSSEGEESFSIKHDCTISNPIVIAIAIAAVKSKYAACIAMGFVGNTTKELYLAYSDSKESIKNSASLFDRTKAFGKAVKVRARNIGAGAVGSFAACSLGHVLPPLS